MASAQIFCYPEYMFTACCRTIDLPLVGGPSRRQIFIKPATIKIEKRRFAGKTQGTSEAKTWAERTADGRRTAISSAMLAPAVAGGAVLRRTLMRH